MNYYIDFDNTLYETARLVKAMLECIANSIVLNDEKILEDVKSTFNSSDDNIYEHAIRAANKYNADEKLILNNLKEVIDNGEKFVYEDSKRFLEKLKSEGHKIILLTFLPERNQEYQLQKVRGSGLAKYFDVMILTTSLKFTLDLKYENGVFIDDKPRDLEGLKTKSPLRLIRMRRSNNKYSNVDMNLENMEEYTSFDDINIDFNK